LAVNREIDLFTLPGGSISAPKVMRETTRSWGRIPMRKSETYVPIHAIWPSFLWFRYVRLTCNFRKNQKEGGKMMGGRSGNLTLLDSIPLFSNSLIDGRGTSLTSRGSPGGESHPPDPAYHQNWIYVRSPEASLEASFLGRLPELATHAAFFYQKRPTWKCNFFTTSPIFRGHRARQAGGERRVMRRISVEVICHPSFH
jgi:hypothetical protein